MLIINEYCEATEEITDERERERESTKWCLIFSETTPYLLRALSDTHHTSTNGKSYVACRGGGPIYDQWDDASCLMCLPVKLIFLYILF
jgi:hypothetical protein